MATRVHLDLLPPNTVPLVNNKYSPAYQESAQVVISKLLEKIGQSGIEPSELTFAFKGHEIQLFKNGTDYLTVKSSFKDKSVTINWKSQIGAQLPEDHELVIHSRWLESWFPSLASDLRSSLKELAEHHQLLTGKGPAFAPRPFGPMQPLPGSPILEKMKCIQPSEKKMEYVTPLSDVVGVLRNLLDLLTLVVAIIGKVGHEITVVIAFLRIGQGLILISKGLFALVSAWERYREAKQVHDLEGMKMARADMIDAALTIVMGAFWIAIGLLIVIQFFHSGAGGVGFPDGSNVYNGLLWGLFYGGFTIDAALGIYSACRKLKSIKQQIKPLEEIIQSKKLTDDGKRKAFLRYFRRMLNLTDEEVKKIREKSPDNADERVLEKLAKKRALAIRAYGKENVELIEKIVNTATDDASLDGVLASFDVVIDKIQENISRVRTEQHFIIGMAMLCLVGNLIGLPTDIIQNWGGGSSVLGLDFKTWAKIGDAMWVGVNFLYLFLDSKRMNDAGQKISVAFYRNCLSSEQKDRVTYLNQLTDKLDEIKRNKEEEARKARKHEEELLLEESRRRAEEMKQQAVHVVKRVLRWIISRL